MERARSRFLQNASGSVGLVFGMSLIPLVVAAGVAVDYARASNARTAMQAALDSTALMLGKEAPSLTTDQIKQKATEYFTSLFNRPEFSNLLVTTDVVKAGTSTLKISVAGDFPLEIMPVVGKTKINMGATSTATWGNSRLRVALALDNTGSMASAGKMPALKNAAHNLLTQLQKAVTNTGDVYVSIIPFSKDVNVGSSNHAASWIRWDLWEEKNGTCSKSSYTTKSSCLDHGKTWTPDNHNTWNGCVTDRDQPNDTNEAVPVAGTQATLFPAEQYSSCPVSLMALSYDFVALNAKIDAMTPTGNTNQTIGLQWAFQSLKASSPLTVPPLSPDFQYQHAIILLTDGLNTQNRFSSSQASIDLRTKAACDAVKAAGVTLYAVQVNTDGDPTSAMLQQCASAPSKFFLLTNSSQIVTTFDQIGTELSQLRLSQ